MLECSELFAPSIVAHRGTFKAWLHKPTDRVFIVFARFDGRGAGASCVPMNGL
jgi:hypothetical protein